MGKGNRLQKFKYAQISIFLKCYFISFSWSKEKQIFQVRFIAFPWKNYFENWLSFSHIHSISTVYFCKNLSELIKYIQKNWQIREYWQNCPNVPKFLPSQKVMQHHVYNVAKKEDISLWEIRILRYSGQIKITIYLPVIWDDIAMVTSKILKLTPKTEALSNHLLNWHISCGR